LALGGYLGTRKNDLKDRGKKTDRGWSRGKERQYRNKISVGRQENEQEKDYPWGKRWKI